MTRKPIVYLLAVGLSLLGWGCKNVQSREDTNTSQQGNGKGRDDFEKSIPLDQYKTTYYKDAATALKAILSRTQPAVVGFGEFHQMEKTAEILSALERFSDDLLPVVAPSSSDLIVETWIPKGCGEQEKRVIQQVEDVSERPKQTENETIKMLKRAKALGVQPHILQIECEDYKRVFETDTEVDFYLMLELVGRLLAQKGQEVMKTREGPMGSANRAESKMVVLYGGAIHNDIHPSEDWKGVTFGPKMKYAAKGKYVEVDLYVPEFIEDSSIIKEEPWFSLFMKKVSDKRTLVIELAEDSYIIGFKKGVPARRHQD